MVFSKAGTYNCIPINNVSAHMSTILPKNLALMLCALAVLAGTHHAGASNTPWARSPEGFGAGTTGGGQAGEIVTVHTREQLAHELCRTLGPAGCSDNTPRIIKLSETIDFTGADGSETDAVCYPTKICNAPDNKSEAQMPMDAKDTRCVGFKMSLINVDTAGKKPLLVGSNKTLLGVGANAGLKGKGLHLNNVSNVIIQNITIRDINNGIVFGGDAIDISNSHHVWINHNRFHNIGRQMLVTHFGNTNNITVSWNIFDGHDIYSANCNNEHYFNVLLGTESKNITVSNNWFMNVAGRAPHVENTAATIHLVNNYFFNDQPTREARAHALDATTVVDPTKPPPPGVHVLVEGNYFHNFGRPITGSSGKIFGALGGPNTAMQTQCKSILERNCYGNIARELDENHFVQDSSVMWFFQPVPQAQIVIPYSASNVPAYVSAFAGPYN